jgi:hypothetical protein
MHVMPKNRQVIILFSSLSLSHGLQGPWGQILVGSQEQEGIILTVDYSGHARTTSRLPHVRLVYTTHTLNQTTDKEAAMNVPIQCRHTQHLQTRNPLLLPFLFLAFFLCVPPPCAVASMVIPYFVVLSNLGRGQARGCILFICEKEERDVENPRRRKDSVCCAY